MTFLDLFTNLQIMDGYLEVMTYDYHIDQISIQDKVIFCEIQELDANGGTLTAPFTLSVNTGDHKVYLEEEGELPKDIIKLCITNEGLTEEDDIKNVLDKMYGKAADRDEEYQDIVEDYLGYFETFHDPDLYHEEDR